MTRQNLESIAESLVADGKGILAADKTVPTLTKRFDTLGIESTEQSRRTYREMLFTSPAAEFISGAIMYVPVPLMFRPARGGTLALEVKPLHLGDLARHYRLAACLPKSQLLPPLVTVLRMQSL
jgi:hypothetical protein